MFYEERLPQAIQYGMTPEQFWYGDIRLIGAYEKAYYRDVLYKGWVQGNYNHIGYGVVMAKAFAKKGEKVDDYPAWVDPIEKIQKQKIKKNDREEQRNQQEWVYNTFFK